jgi:hypothetical protein
MGATSLRWMFTKTDALEIFGTPPLTNIAACGYFRKLGFAGAFDDQPVFADSDGTYGIFSLFITDWLRQTADLVDRGAKFIDDVEQQCHGSCQMPIDEQCRRHVGAAVEMIAGGQPQKAAVFYNRWAAMCGRLPLILISVSPAVFALLGAVIIFHNDRFEVVECPLAVP